MARTIIKESELRKYIRSIIREAIEDEARKASPETENELNKMIRGEDFNYGLLGTTARQKVRDYFKSKGLTIPTKPKGGIPPRIINGTTGEDKTPENSPKALAMTMQRKKNEKKKYDASRHYEKKNKDEYDEMNKLVNEPSDGNMDNGQTPNTDTSSLDKDQYTQNWLNMSDDEKSAMRDKIRQNRQDKRDSELLHYRDELNKRRPVAFPTPQEIKREIVDLKAKQAQLGQHNDINDRKWKEYDYLIRDREKILNKYYGGGEKDSNDELADEIVNNALKDDLSGEEEFKDNYGIEKTKPQDQEQDEVQYDDFDDDIFGRNKKKRDYDELKSMGFYNDDDDEY